MRTFSPSASASAAAARSSLAERAGSCSLSSSAAASSPPLGLPDLARELLDLGPHRLGARQPGPVGHVGLDHGVHLGGVDATAGRARP